MTFNDVRRILKEIDFDMNCCNVLEGKTVLAGDGVVVFRENGVYKVCYVERNEQYGIEEYANEHDASRAFLKKLKEGFGRWYDFARYIQ